MAKTKGKRSDKSKEQLEAEFRARTAGTVKRVLHGCEAIQKAMHSRKYPLSSGDKDKILGVLDNAISEIRAIAYPSESPEIVEDEFSLDD
jgi:hypothetical protein